MYATDRHPVIGLTGKAGAGKSTAAEYLAGAHGFKRYSMASPLKHMLYKLDPIVGTCEDFTDTPLKLSEAIEGAGETTHWETHLKEFYPEYRRLLQVLGTECIRAIDPNFWVNIMVKEVTELRKEAPVVIDDLRFQNEVDAVARFYNGTPTMSPYQGASHIWFIGNMKAASHPDAHSSEAFAGRMGEGRTISNDGTLEDFWRELGTAWIHLKEGGLV